jgi:hypothetical protein
LLGRGGDEAGVPDGPHELHGFAGHAESRFDLRTDGHPFDKTAQDGGQKAVALVSAVEANLIAEKTAADPQS